MKKKKSKAFREWRKRKVKIREENIGQKEKSEKIKRKEKGEKRKEKKRKEKRRK